MIAILISFHLSLQDQHICCSCPFYYKRGTCKHELEEMITIGDISIPNPYLAQLAEVKEKGTTLKAVRKMKGSGRPISIPKRGTAVNVSHRLDGRYQYIQQHRWTKPELLRCALCVCRRLEGHLHYVAERNPTRSSYVWSPYVQRVWFPLLQLKAAFFL